MAIDCSPQAVATDAKCFTCLAEKQLLGMAVYLLGQNLLSLDPMADVSPQALATASRCYTQCLSGKGLLGAMVYLLCQIDNNGGGGGSGFDWIIWEDTGPNPSGPPSDPTKAGMVRFRDGNPPVVWDPADQDWH